MPENEPYVCKELVIGWLIKKIPYHHSVKDRTATHFISVEPITYDINENMDGLYKIELEKKDEIIGILPAQPGTIMVYGTTKESCGGENAVGIEIPGIEHPDWKKKITEEKWREL